MIATRNYLNNLISEINENDTNEDKLKFIIEIGEELELMNDKYRTNDFLVKGCTSLTYLAAEINDNKIIFSGDSESLFAKGYLYILINAFKNTDSKEFLNESSNIITSFINDINLDLSMTPSRMNSFGNIYQAMLERTLDIVDWDLLD